MQSSRRSRGIHGAWKRLTTKVCLSSEHSYSLSALRERSPERVTHDTIYGAIGVYLLSTHFDLDADRLGALPLDRFNLVDLASAALAAKSDADEEDKKDDHRNFPAREPGALYGSRFAAQPVEVPELTEAQEDKEERPPAGYKRPGIHLRPQIGVKEEHPQRNQ